MTESKKLVMQQALVALEVATTPIAIDRQEVLKAVDALREAIAQPVSTAPAIWHGGAATHQYQSSNNHIETLRGEK